MISVSTLMKIEEHITHLCQIFEKCRVYQICLNPDKCKFMGRKGKILGNIVSRSGISIDAEKIAVIVDELPLPINFKEVYICMGHYGYYRRFTYMCAKSSIPIYVLLVVFEWTKDCEASFEKLKKALVFTIIL